MLLSPPQKKCKNWGSIPVPPVVALVVSVLQLLTVWVLTTDKLTIVHCAKLRREITAGMRERVILSEIVPKMRFRPREDNVTHSGPTHVKVNMIIRAISDLDDRKMEFNVQLTLKCFWKNERLQFNSGNGTVPYVTLNSLSNVWLPDLFFRNERNGHFHNILVPNTYLRVYPDGNVLYSTRLSLTLICPMNLKYFPFDTQRCQLPLASFSLTSKDLILSWKNDNPLQFSDVILVKHFDLIKNKTRDFYTHTETGRYSCLDVDLIFKRQQSYYTIMVYIPCSMFVIASWFCFWFEENAINAKVTLGVTILLTLSFLACTLSQSLPAVSYVKAIDVWIGTCITFVFGVLLETALLSYFLTSEKNNELRNDVLRVEEAEEIKDQTSSDNFILEQDFKPKRNKRRSTLVNIHAQILTKLPTKRSSRTDFISRFAFPILFVIFTFAYLLAYRINYMDDLE